MAREDRSLGTRLYGVTKWVVFLGVGMLLCCNIWKAGQVCARVHGELRATQAQLDHLEAQRQELVRQVEELKDEDGLDLAMKKRLYLKKDERWIVFEHNGRALTGGELPPAASPEVSNVETPVQPAPATGAPE